MRCPKCASEVPDDSTFCPNCGDSVAAEGTSGPTGFVSRLSRRRWPLLASAGGGLAAALLAVLFVLGVFAGGGSDIVSRAFVPSKDSLPFVLRHPSGASLTIVKAVPEGKNAPVTVRIERDPEGASDAPLPDGLSTAGEVYSFEVSGLESGEFQLELPYDKAKLAESTTGAQIAAASSAEGPWLLASPRSVDGKKGILTALTDHLSFWQVVIVRAGCPRLPSAFGLACVRVTGVEDGDTICVVWPGERPTDPPQLGPTSVQPWEFCEKETDIKGDLAVRFIGIDAPELGINTPELTKPAQCYAEKAKDKVAELLKVGNRVLVELDPAEKLDLSGRILGYVWDRSGMVNERLVREGFARERHWFPPEALGRESGKVLTQKYYDRLSAAGDEARRNGRGLWGECVEVAYQCHIAFDGWTNWFWQEETCGTTGKKARQMEAVRIWLPPAGFSIEYRAHVAFEGWLNWVRADDIAGTVEEGRPMEAIQMRLVGAPPGIHVECRAHVAVVGWQEWVRDGGTAGTVGEGRAMEALEIRLVGDGTHPIVIEPPGTPTPATTAPAGITPLPGTPPPPATLRLFVSSGVCDLPISCGDGPSRLYAIDPVGTADVLIGTIHTAAGFRPVIGDIALAPNGGLFGVGVKPDGNLASPFVLYSIDKNTATATAVGTDTGFSLIDSLVFRQDGRLFGATDDGILLQIDTSTGAGRRVGSGVPAWNSDGDGAFAPDGTLYWTATRKGEDQFGPSSLITVDDTTALVTRAVPIGFHLVGGLAFEGSQLLGFTIQAPGCSGGAVISINTETGAGTFVKCLPFDAFGAAN